MPSLSLGDLLLRASGDHSLVEGEEYLQTTLNFQLAPDELTTIRSIAIELAHIVIRGILEAPQEVKTFLLKESEVKLASLLSQQVARTKKAKKNATAAIIVD